MRKPFQTDSMDDDLKVSLWNCFERVFVSTMEQEWTFGTNSGKHGFTGSVLYPVWVDFFKWPLPGMPASGQWTLEKVREWYFGRATWNKVYDFLQFIANLRGDGSGSSRDVGVRGKVFASLCNDVLERESSAYRFVGRTLAPITNEAEVQAIERACTPEDTLLTPISTHIETALKLLADREHPDYRNSIKESISAVEALCKVIAKDEKGTLGGVLEAVAGKVKLHPKQKDAFKALYGYTSDGHGIRHALKDDAEPEAEDARYMLVTCSGFVNYLIEKARKHGLLP